MNLTLNKGQEVALRTLTGFLAHPHKHYMRLVGFAGTGKTTVLNVALGRMEEILRAAALIKNVRYTPMTVHKTATTHKAASLLDNTEGTIHSLMGCQVRKDFKTGKEYLEQVRKPKVENGSLVVIDEASYLDNDFLTVIVQTAAEYDLKVLFLLDKDQLSPVGAENNTIPVMDLEDCVEAQLTEIMRHGGDIAEAAGKYREAVTTKQFPEIPEVNGIIERLDGPAFRQKVHEIFGNDSKETACILGWTNNVVDAYNSYVREQVMGFTEQDFQPGERVILGNFIPNTYPNETELTVQRSTKGRVHVSHTGPINEISTTCYTVICDYGKEHKLHVADDSLLVKKALQYLRKEKLFANAFKVQESIAKLRLPYASTVHKAQGSTYDYVFVDLKDIGKNWDAEQVARLLYVALSRARKKIFLYGDLPQKYRS